MAQLVNNPPAMWETWVPSLGWEDPLEKGKATHSSMFYMGFPGGSDSKSICLQCWRPRFNLRIRKIPWRRKWQPTPVLLLENSMDEGAWWATVHGAADSDMTERLHFLISTVYNGFIFSTSSPTIFILSF